MHSLAYAATCICARGGSMSALRCVRVCLGVGWGGGGLSGNDLLTSSGAIEHGLSSGEQVGVVAAFPQLHDEHLQLFPSVVVFLVLRKRKSTQRQSSWVIKHTVRGS